MIGAFLAVVVWLAGAAQTPDPQLDAGARAYRDGRFGDAAAAYRTILETWPGAPEPVLFNLGNCAFRAGDHARAALLYRRVLSRRPGDAEARFNLRLAQRRLGLDPAPTSPIERAAAWLDRNPGRGALLAGLAQLVGLVGLIGLRRPLARGACAALVAAGLAAAIHGLRIDGGTPATRDAVVLTPELPLRAAPHGEVPVTRRLSAGEVVRVVEASDRWARVEDERGGGGWLRTDGIGRVDGTDAAGGVGAVSSSRR